MCAIAEMPTAVQQHSFCRGIVAAKLFESSQVLGSEPTAVFDFDRPDTALAIHDKIDLGTATATPKIQLFPLLSLRCPSTHLLNNQSL